MVVVKLQGGLGNQMFQYALGKSLAERNKDRLVLDLTFLLDRTPRSNFVFRKYDLGIFSNIKPEFTLLSRLALALRIPVFYYGLSLFISRLKNALGIQKYFRDIDLAFHPEILDLKGDLYLDGYWQTEKYFENIEDELRAEFSLNMSLDEKSENLLRTIENFNAVCLNVRRGDFVSLPGSIAAHGFVGTAYYDEGIRRLAAQVKNPHFFVFSDEIDWCRENIKSEYPMTFVGHEYAGKKFGTYLRLMSACQHFLIPNSTFGWWAAWLSKNPNKIIIAPAQWARQESAYPKDLVPQNWLRI